jgi:hypothetical protein
MRFVAANALHCAAFNFDFDATIAATQNAGGRSPVGGYVSHFDTSQVSSDLFLNDAALLPQRFRKHPAFFLI